MSAAGMANGAGKYGHDGGSRRQRQRIGRGFFKVEQPGALQSALKACAAIA